MAGLAVAALHFIANYGGLKNHLTSLRGKVLLGVFVVALLASFIPISGERDDAINAGRV